MCVFGGKRQIRDRYQRNKLKLQAEIINCCLLFINYIKLNIIGTATEINIRVIV